MWGLAVVCLPLFFQMPVSCTTTAFASEVTDTTMRESNTNVTITIDNKGYYYITETMDITFYASYTEFLRDIPYKNTVYVQENGTVKKHTSYAQIRDRIQRNCLGAGSVYARSGRNGYDRHNGERTCKQRNTVSSHYIPGRFAGRRNDKLLRIPDAGEIRRQ